MGPVIYYHLERNFTQKKEIPKKTKQFSSCLKQIFGGRAEYFIKMIIVKNLYIEIEESLEEIKHWSFTDYVKDARKKYVEKNRRKYRKLP